MSIDYYACVKCKKTFPDCGEYFPCDCGENFCSTKCGMAVFDEDGFKAYSSCFLCRGEGITDKKLLKFILQHFKLSYGQAFDLYKNRNK